MPSGDQFCCCFSLEQGTLLQLLTCPTMNLVTSPKGVARYGDPLGGYRKKRTTDLSRLTVVSRGAKKKQAYATNQ